MKIQGVKAYVSNGKTYAYQRKSGKPLQSVYGSAEFLAELAEIERAYQSGKKPETEEKPGTWGAIVVKYKGDRLPQLARRTQSDYHKVLDWLSPLGAMPLSEWSRGFAIQTRDKAFKQRGRRFANYCYPSPIQLEPRARVHIRASGAERQGDSATEGNEAR
jgi:hypothetical protein